MPTDGNSTFRAVPAEEIEAATHPDLASWLTARVASWRSSTGRSVKLAARAAGQAQQSVMRKGLPTVACAKK